MNGPDLQWNYNIHLQAIFPSRASPPKPPSGDATPEPPLGAHLPLDPPAGGMDPPDPAEGVPPSALHHVEECTYFWGVNTSWGIDMAESKGPLH